MSESAGTREVPTGVALEKARRRVGYTAPDAADALGISPLALGEYESGLRTPTDELIEEMSRLYGVEPGRFASRPWVPRVPPRYDEETGLLWLGWNSIAVKDRSNEHIARAVAAALRSMRSLADDSPVVLRSSELPLLSTLFDLHDEKLPDRLMVYLRISPGDALGLVNQMVILASVHS